MVCGWRGGGVTRADRSALLPRGIPRRAGDSRCSGEYRRRHQRRGRVDHCRGGARVVLTVAEMTSCWASRSLNSAGCRLSACVAMTVHDGIGPLRAARCEAARCSAGWVAPSSERPERSEHAEQDMQAFPVEQVHPKQVQADSRHWLGRGTRRAGLLATWCIPRGE